MLQNFGPAGRERANGNVFTVPPMAEDTMRYWLAYAAKEARDAKGRHQVHIAAGLDRNQSTIDRFETTTSWPRNVDLTVAAYADDLDIEPIEIWERAVELWRGRGSQPTLADLKNRPIPPGGTGALSETPLRPGTGQPKRRRGR